MNTKRKSHLKAVINAAKRNPKLLQDIVEHEQREIRIVSDYLNQVISQHEYETRLKTNPGEPKSVILNSMIELKFVMNYLGIAGDIQLPTFTHEIKHFKEAMKWNLPTRFVVTIFRDKNRLVCAFGTQVSLSETALAEDQKRQVLREIIAAPGQDLSQQDKRMLMEITPSN